MKKIVTYTIFMAAATAANAISMRGTDFCTDTTIRSIQLRRADNAALEPVIALNSGEQVRLTFDDIGTTNRSFTYRIVLCDADWTESTLPYSDYVAGFQEDEIRTYKQSFGTMTNYTFFELLLPNSTTNLTLSGNYKIQVVDTDEPDKVLFQKSFMVVERTLPFKILSEINLTPTAEQRGCMQQLNIKVDYQDMMVQNPSSDIKVRILQNGHSTPTAPPQAVFVSSSGVDYSFYDKNLYHGGAEYRQFDLSSFEYRTLRVRHIEVLDGMYHVVLDPDGIVNQHFTYLDDNGRYSVHSARYSENSETESGYAQVHFTLFSPQKMDGSLYIFGELTNWELSPHYEMRYNPQRQAYERALLLKQGYYDYRYVLLKNSMRPDFSAVEYCSRETENSYGIYVYYRSMTDRHDRLVAVSWINTKK